MSEIVSAAPETVQGERHVSAVAGGGEFSKRQGAMLLTCAAGAAIASILLRPHGKPAGMTDHRTSPYRSMR